jgi:hypothetical protein
LFRGCHIQIVAEGERQGKITAEQRKRPSRFLSTAFINAGNDRSLP